ncbi:MAG: restriction endonuclease subunit S, partial [Ruminococcus sp.]|nr:restriction endonuclease subunit S [Ruminococcus sp.]
MTKLEQLIKELCSNGVEYKKLGDICNKIVDGMHNLPKEACSSGQYPILSAQNVHNDTIDLITSKYVDALVFEKENVRTGVAKGDVLLTIVGAIGRTALVQDELKALFQRSICVIKPDNNCIDSS